MKHWSTGIVVACLLGIMSSSAQAQERQFSGYMFGDLFWVPTHHDTTLEGSNGFWFRRIYFTFDSDLNKTLAVRLRLEMASAGDFSTATQLLVPFVKDAYLRWLAGGTQVYLGISEPPTFRFIEKVWGYRSIEKTPVDLQRMGASRDFGVAARGNFGDGKRFSYHAMLGNGSGNSSEVNQGKKLMLSLAYQLTSDFTFEIYGDWNDNTRSTDWFTWQGFLAYQNDKTRAGLQYVQQDRQSSGPDVRLRVLSAFGCTVVSPKLNLFARVDRQFDPNPQGDRISYLPFATDAKSTLLIGGLDFMPSEHVDLMPNAEVVLYDGAPQGENPGADVIPRVTFFYRF